jgi:hypothetical protein
MLPDEFVRVPCRAVQGSPAKWNLIRRSPHLRQKTRSVLQNPILAELAQRV